MAKSLSPVFVCQECGSVQPKWSGKCPVCGAWGSLLEQAPDLKMEKYAKGRVLKPARITDITQEKANNRLATGVTETDEVLGSGIVPGSIILLAGEPGIGKSTLLLQLAEGVAAGHKVLYVTGEESLNQVSLRAKRLKVDNPAIDLLAATTVEDIAVTIADGKYGLVIIDSIQTMNTANLAAAAGSISQITASAQILQSVAKQSHTALLLVGHVTKEGNIAGPKILEHLVDVVLYLEGERFDGFRLLRGVKNRFGSTNEVGIFEMKENGLQPVKNPSAAFLSERTVTDGSVVLATLEGTRSLLVEVQALVSASPFGYPKRTAAGFDLNRLNLLLAVLSKRAGLNLGDKDVYVNMVGGMKINEPAADLAVALAIASAYKAKPVHEGLVVFGEIGLSGEIRSVAHVEKRIKEAEKLHFKGALGPASKHKFIKPARTLSDAIKQGLKG